MERALRWETSPSRERQRRKGLAPLRSGKLVLKYEATECFPGHIFPLLKLLKSGKKCQN